MAAKLVVLLALAAVAHCSESGLHDHAALVEPAREQLTSFSYDVADPYTGDFKSQSETRVGGTVQGQYSLLDADGTRRTVDYAADDLNGFNAVVRKDAVGVAAPVVAERVVAPAVAPVAARLVAAPNVLTGGALLADRSYAAPTVYAASAPLLSRTVLNYGGARTVAAPHLLTGAARLYDSRSFAAPAVVNTGVLARSFAAPTVLSGGARLLDSRNFAAPTVYNTGLLSHGVAAPVLSSPLVTRTLATPGVYAASAPLVTGGYSTGHDLFATRAFAPHVVTGGLVGVGGRLVSPLNTLSGRLVTGHGLVRSDW